jgi:tetratricopeptide (TPR) repeat protein
MAFLAGSRICDQVTRIHRLLHSNRYLLTILAVVVLAAAGLSMHTRQTAGIGPADGYVGSSSCRNCHEKFYELWSTSHHGLAMQPFSARLVQNAQLASSQVFKIGETSYKAEVTDNGGWIVESSGAGEHRYPIEQVLGGKNVYYFLTPLERGHLQVLPLAFDVRSKTWMDSTKSMTMHENVPHSQAVAWRDRALTFNTSCYGCHVSQISTNYDSADDSYNTTWREPGINCETCHGPAGKHVRLLTLAAKKHEVPSDVGLISFKKITPAQRSDACASCHAKMGMIAEGFQTGDHYFDYFNLITFENEDFYPDGRDLGENYTYTSWLMSPCAKSGKLDCVLCHTSSGRYRFAKGDPNAACLPCHAEIVNNAAPHTHHKPDSTGNQCVSCHMPMTEYARMRRSDHSMRAPTPATTIAYKSPNACNSCHKDKDARWANTVVRKWYPRDYQAEALRQGALIEAARKRDWSQLPQMLAYIEDPKHDSIFTASLIRLLGQCPDSRKFATMRVAIRDPSPLVRANAVDVLSEYPDLSTVQILVDCTKDESRLVRIRSAAGLNRVPPGALDEGTKAKIGPAAAEYLASLNLRQDDFAQHMNLGNYHADRGELPQSATEYEKAESLRPGFAPPLVNVAVVYSKMGDMKNAEGALRRAIAAEPTLPAAHFNLGLLLAETRHTDEAEKELRKTLQLEPSNAAAAYDLAILVGNTNPREALALCQKAAELNPDNPKYRSAVAYYREHSSVSGTP